MVDPDPGYRPKRAFVEPAEPAGEAPSTPPGSTGPPVRDEAEQAPPLFRDEVAGPGTAPRPPAARRPEALGEETRVVRPLTFRPRRPPAPDEDATTLLPRTAVGGRRPAADEDDDERRRGLLGPRLRLGLLIGAVAAVVVVGIALIYAVASVGTPTVQPTAGASTTPGTPSGSTAPTNDPSALLGDEMLLTPAAAKTIGGRTWSVALTQRGAGTDTRTAACLTADPVEGEPIAQQEVLRLLSSTGTNPPSALHQATSYAAVEDAAQAYALAARALGSCLAPGSSIDRGAAVTGLGDQSTALVASVVAGGKTTRHTVVLSQTGRVLNVLDATQAKGSIDVSSVAGALAAVTEAQCQAAGGACAGSPEVAAGPPPLGGDEPGFLATGDLPPAGEADESWNAAPAEEPATSFLGSQCETVTWNRTGAVTAGSRVYLVPSSTKFGLNDIVLTMKSDRAATDFVEKIRSDLKSCSKRQLTASVSEPARVSGVGASGAQVTGWTSTVAQKSTEGTQRYRVGIVSSGSKVAYTFLNPLDSGYDLTPSEWDRVAVRAGQRMTQAP